eukprot:424527-Amorphochlora_amoeboformis.AAC.1
MCFTPGLIWIAGATCSLCTNRSSRKSLVVAQTTVQDDCRCGYPSGTLVFRPQINNRNYGGFTQTCGQPAINFRVSFTCQLDSCRVADDPHVRTFS